MKLFQIEEPEGGPVDPEAPGAAIGIDASGKLAEVAFAVGGNTVILADREDFERDLPVPPLDAPAEAWQAVFEGARLRAERALARPVTHAVLAVADDIDNAAAMRLIAIGAAAALDLLRIVRRHELAGSSDAPVCAAAMMAEDMAPRSEAP